jgi:hypothetical protein
MSNLHVTDDYKVREMLTLHAQKLVNEKLDWHSPCAYLMNANSSRDVSLDEVFVKYTPEELIESQNTNLRSVQWLMEQVTKNTDHATHVVAGITLPDGEIVSHVFPKRVKRASVPRSSLLR